MCSFYPEASYGANHSEVGGGGGWKEGKKPETPICDMGQITQRWGGGGGWKEGKKPDTPICGVVYGSNQIAGLLHFTADIVFVLPI